MLGARPGDTSLHSDSTYLSQITLHHYLLHNTQLRRYTSFMLLFFCMVAVIFQLEIYQKEKNYKIILIWL